MVRDGSLSGDIANIIMSRVSIIVAFVFPLAYLRSLVTKLRLLDVKFVHYSLMILLELH